MNPHICKIFKILCFCHLLTLKFIFTKQRKPKSLQGFIFTNPRVIPEISPHESFSQKSKLLYYLHTFLQEQLFKRNEHQIQLKNKNSLKASIGSITVQKRRTQAKQRNYKNMTMKEQGHLVAYRFLHFIHLSPPNSKLSFLCHIFMKIRI